MSPAKGLTAANREARRLLGNVFESPGRALERVSGKEVLRRLSAWVHECYDRGISMRDIVRQMNVAEIHAEVRAVIDAIEGNKPFSRSPEDGDDEQ